MNERTLLQIVITSIFGIRFVEKHTGYAECSNCTLGKGVQKLSSILLIIFHFQTLIVVITDLSAVSISRCWCGSNFWWFIWDIIGSTKLYIVRSQF